MMMRRHFILGVLWTVVITADGLTFNDCAYMAPESPALEPNTNLTAFCILDQACLQEMKLPIHAREIFWKIGYQVLPEGLYTVINDSVSSVTFEPTLSMHTVLTCNFKAYGQTDMTLHGTEFTLGYPPEKPKDLTCICYNMKTLTCTWEPGRPPIMATNYTLHQYWSQERKKCVATTGNNFCTLNYPDFSVHIDSTFTVEAVNALGSATSEPLRLDIINVVKPNPPQILTGAPVLERVLKIEWRNPFGDDYSRPLEYNIRYMAAGSSGWSEVPADDLQKTRSSFILQDLLPYTDYIISIRCKQIIKGFWSEWSKNYTATTAESAPSQGPEIWRKIIKTTAEKERTIRLMWKGLESHANGIILGYNVTVKKGPEVVDLFTATNTTYEITVSKDSYEVVLTAFNGRGSSPASTLFIPSATDKVVQPADLSFTVFSKDGLLWVEWTPAGRVQGYVIEWCANSVSMDCDVEWQREPSITGRTFLRGDIKPFVYYLVRLNELHRVRQDRTGTAGTYLEQGVPEVGPKVRTTSTGKTKATLAWDPIPLSQRHGFITNYTIKYEANSGQPKYVTVNATVTKYTLESLAAQTAYQVSVSASTEQGGQAGPSFSFNTLTFENGEVEAIVVSSCLGFLVLILVLCFLFCNKREQIKKHIWPNVPDPSKSNIAQWSPQTPSRHEPKRHPFQDGPFTDVSVVEITDDKKFYSDPDLKSEEPIKKNTSEGLSSGIGGSSCLSSPQLSDSDGISSAQNTSSTVQYSTVIMGGYQGQTPMFSRSESTQPLLIAEERPDEQQQLSEEEEAETPSQYFKQNFTPEDGGKIQEPPPQDPAAQILHLAGFSDGHDSPDSPAGHHSSTDGPSQADAPNEEQKTYLPQSVRQGGYIPQ